MQVHPRDGKNSRRTEWCRRHWANRRVVSEWVAGQEGCEVGGHSDRADPWAATTVGDAERLVKVQVAHIGAKGPRPRNADESVDLFVKALSYWFDGRLKQEREIERDRCCRIVYGMAGSDNVAQRTVEAIRGET